MKSQGFLMKHTVLNDKIYKASVLEDVIEDMKRFPTLTTPYDYYKFDLPNKENIKRGS